MTPGHHVPQGALDDPSPLVHCGITFFRDTIRGTTTDGVPVEVDRVDLKSLEVRASVERSRTIHRTVAAILLVMVAAAIVLSAVGVIHILGGFLRDLGSPAAVILALGGATYRLLSGVWDPRHVLLATTSRGLKSIDCPSRPDPFQLIATVEQLQQRFGYQVALYPTEASERPSAA